jgi:hypothetical protein
VAASRTWTRTRRGRGASWWHIAAELGIAVETIKRWAATGAAAETALVPVEVIAEVSQIGGGDRELRLVTRAGHRIEGLDLAAVIELVRVLG